MGTLLNDLSAFDREVSHADIIQALFIATAVRVSMAEAAERHGVTNPIRLLDIGVEPDGDPVTYSA